MKKRLALALVVALSGCGQSPSAPPSPSRHAVVSTPTPIPRTLGNDGEPLSDEELSCATLSTLPSDLGAVDAHAARHGRVTFSMIERTRARIRCLRDWAATEQRPDVRAAYIGWFDYYDKRCDAAEEELRNPSPQPTDGQSVYERALKRSRGILPRPRCEKPPVTKKPAGAEERSDG